MTPLRKRLLEDMQLRGLAQGTQATYVRSICRLARYYHKSPDLITEQELRDYVMQLNAGKLVQRSTAKLQLCGIKFFFRKTLQRRWPGLRLMRAPKGRRLLVVLSPEEVSRILEAVRFPVYRVCLTTIYSCGLRVSEGVSLQIRSVDSARMMLRVLGKGSFDDVIYFGSDAAVVEKLFARVAVNGLLVTPSAAASLGDPS